MDDARQTLHPRQPRQNEAEEGGAAALKVQGEQGPQSWAYSSAGDAWK